MKHKKSFKRMIISFVLALSMFFVLLTIESNMLEGKEKKKIVVVKNGVTIDDGTVIDKDNVNQYFELVEIEDKFLTENNIEDVNSLVGLVSMSTLYQKEIIVKERFLPVDDILSKIENPVEVSIETNNLSNVVGGTLRKGDIIDLNIIDRNLYVNKTILNDVYVSKVFDKSGIEVKRTEKDVPSYIINIIIEEDMVSKLNDNLVLGELRLTKK